MTLTVNTLIRAGSMAQNVFTLKDNFEIRIFPADCPDLVIVHETHKPERVGEGMRSYIPMPRRDEVELFHFAARENSDSLRMGYSPRLNILCLSLP